MARKNRQQLVQNRVEFYKQDEKERLEKAARKNKVRLENKELMRQGKFDPFKYRKGSVHKPKVAPVVANKDKNTRKMAKMMKKMAISDGPNKKRRMADSSDDDSSDEG